MGNENDILYCEVCEDASSREWREWQDKSRYYILSAYMIKKIDELSKNINPFKGMKRKIRPRIW